MLSHKSIIPVTLLLCLALVVYILYGSGVLSGLATGGNWTNNLISHEVPADALQQLGTMQDSRLTEISGIDSSIKNEKSFWVHNDSGHPAEVFLISETGQTLMKVNLKGATNIDWEDICTCELSSGEAVVVVGDVGDNAGRRTNCCLYVFNEPKLEDVAAAGAAVEPANIEVTDYSKIEFTYSDGPRNCEAIAFDSEQQKLFLVQKGRDKNEVDETFGVYTLGLQATDEPTVAKRVAEVGNRMVTGADFSDDGKQLLLCDYVLGSFYQKSSTHKWDAVLNTHKFRTIPLPVQRQREAICFRADGAVIAVSEFGKQPIWKIDLKTILAPE